MKFILNNHFNDATIYKLVDSNCKTKVMKKIAKIHEICKDNLTEKEKKNLIHFSYNTSKFCGLPEYIVHFIEQSELKL